MCGRDLQMILSRLTSSFLVVTSMEVAVKEYRLMKDTHLRGRLATFGLMAVLLVLTVCSIGATVIIWQATTQVREAVRMSDLDAVLKLAGRLRKAREATGLTLAQLSEQTGIDEPSLSRLETGKTLNPTVATLFRVAAALGLDLGFTLTATPSQPASDPAKAGRNGPAPG